MRHTSATWMAVLLPWALGGCGAGWRRLDDLTPRALPVRAQVQLWMGHQTRVLHAVTLGTDSLTGVPFHRPPDCDSCRVVIARSMVDSMRLGNQERGALGSIGFGYLALGATALVLYLSLDTD
jgi:hypothetical protein